MYHDSHQVHNMNDEIYSTYQFMGYGLTEHDTYITGINPEAIQWGTTTVTTHCAPACSQVLPIKPQGSGPEVLKRERGHVSAESGVLEVGVFKALQPNVSEGYCPSFI